MQEIKCPKCGEKFTIDEAGYAAIVKQVRDDEYNKEIKRVEQRFNDDKIKDIELEKVKLQSEFNEQLSDKESEILELKSQLEKTDTDKKLAVNEALSEKNEELLKKDALVAELKAKLEKVDSDKKLAVSEALTGKNEEITKQREEIIELKSKIDSSEKEKKILESSLKETYEAKLKGKDDEIAYYKDLKAKMSTKMVGETLEQHCEIEFNKLRPTAFQNAYFEKDNDAKTGSKGDYIYREEVDGVELISIMFEMKNEMDTTATKHKNEHFFKELDKDRNEKGCEYAVLVSLLEADNELYNQGIVDVSYKYDKMYVIRPQFFIPMITLLRNAAFNSLKYKKELAVVRNQNIDISNFEDNLNDFKGKFQRNYELASKKFSTAIDEIDKTIDHLNKIKENLLSSDKNLRLANTKLEDVTIKKLCKNNPTMQLKFEEIAKSTED